MVFPIGILYSYPLRRVTYLILLLSTWILFVVGEVAPPNFVRWLLKHPAVVSAAAAAATVASVSMRLHLKIEGASYYVFVFMSKHR